MNPTMNPTANPTANRTANPTQNPTMNPLCTPMMVDGGQALWGAAGMLDGEAERQGQRGLGRTTQ